MDKLEETIEQLIDQVAVVVTYMNRIEKSELMRRHPHELRNVLKMSETAVKVRQILLEKNFPKGSK